MTTKNAPTLQLTYEQFLAVLRQWDTYARVEFSEMARGFPVVTLEDSRSGGYRTGAAILTALKLSKLAEIIWKTLEAGPDEVDRIHDESFVDSQVEHFKKCYSSPERVESQLISGYGTLEPPANMFFKLGKPAQMAIMRDGLLEEAIKTYQQAEEISHNNEQAEKIERSWKWQQKKQITENRNRARELDRDQCVFCGVQVTTITRRYAQLSPDRDEPDSVVVCCRFCQTKLKHKAPGEADPVTTFGRFSRLEGETEPV